MKKTLVFLSLIALFVSCGENPKQANTNDSTEETIAIEKPSLNLANFNAEADKWVNKEIEVVGIVDHVCKHGGKRLFLVDDFGDVHIDGEKRFDDALVGSELVITGLVKELRVDESYCLQQEKDFIKKHSEGLDSDDVYAQKMEHIKSYRDSMATTGQDHISFYSIDYISHVVK
jgi:stage V sporulation protein SpoVS